MILPLQTSQSRPYDPQEFEAALDHLREQTFTTIAALEESVKAVFAQRHVKLVRVASKKKDVGGEKRLVRVRLQCEHGVSNAQTSYQLSKDTREFQQHKARFMYQDRHTPWRFAERRLHGILELDGLVCLIFLVSE